MNTSVKEYSVAVDDYNLVYVTTRGRCATHIAAKGHASVADINGHNDWMLPTVKELTSIYQHCGLDTKYPEVTEELYWTSEEISNVTAATVSQRTNQRQVNSNNLMIPYILVRREATSV